MWAFGLGLGYLGQAMCRVPGARVLHGVVCCRRAFASAVQQGVGQWEWLLDPRVQLSLAGDCHSPAFLGTDAYCVSPASLALADPDAWPLRDALMFDLHGEFRRRSFAAREALMRGSVAANQEIFSEDPDAADLLGSTGLSRLGDRRVCVLGAGPSLDGALEWLRQNREHLFVVAPTTVIRPLHGVGLAPDLVVAVDPREGLIAHLASECLPTLRDVPLVYLPSVHPTLMARWPGPRFGAHLQLPSHDRWHGEFPRLRLFCQGSVGHACVDLAAHVQAQRQARTGAKECSVLLTGFDLAFVGDQSHASAVAPESRQPLTGIGTVPVLGRDGGTLRSNLTWVGFLRDLESYISRSPVGFSLLPGHGARIRGVQSLTGWPAHGVEVAHG